jgi:SAM-dependent methyltransferase
MWPVILPLLEIIKPSDSILDLGCGNGRLLTALTHPQQYLGIDFSETLLLEAEKLHPHHLFRRGDLTDPATFDTLDKYDYVFCLAVLHHLDLDQQNVLLQRLKKLRGKIILSVWDLTKTQYKPLDSNPNHVLIPFKGIDRPCYIHTEDTLRRLILSAGFNIDFFSQKDGNFLAIIKNNAQHTNSNRT